MNLTRAFGPRCSLRARRSPGTLRFARASGVPGAPSARVRAYRASGAPLSSARTSP